MPSDTLEAGYKGILWLLGSENATSLNVLSSCHSEHLILPKRRGNLIEEVKENLSSFYVLDAEVGCPGSPLGSLGTITVKRFWVPFVDTKGTRVNRKTNNINTVILMNIRIPKMCQGLPVVDTNRVRTTFGDAEIPNGMPRAKFSMTV